MKQRGWARKICLARRARNTWQVAQWTVPERGQVLLQSLSALKLAWAFGALQRWYPSVVIRPSVFLFLAPMFGNWWMVMHLVAQVVFQRSATLEATVAVAAAKLCRVS